MRRLLAGLFVFIAVAACREAGAAPRERFLTGVALNEIHPGHDLAPYRGALTTIHRLGARMVLLPVYGYVDSAGAAAVDTLFEPPVSAAEYRSFVRRIVREAHGAGLGVLIIPYLNVRRDNGVDWRGNLAPPSWARWFRSYDAWLAGWTRIAAEERVEMLAVGAELITAEHERAAWRHTIRAVRARYRGRLIYSCNWDHYRDVPFLDRVDAVGISAYFSIPWDKPTTLGAFRANWDSVRVDLRAFAHTLRRPLLFTEVGIPSVSGGYRDPWNYLQEGDPAPEEQAEALRIFRDVWRNTPELTGAFIWCYSPFRGGPRDTSYSIRDKPAESIVREWFGGD